MCQAIRFTINDHLITVKLTDSNPCVPVIMRSGNIMLMPWGNPDGHIPLYPRDGVLYRDHVLQGKWKAYIPKPIKILCQAYMLLDASGQERWFESTEKHQTCIKGVVASVWGKERAYVLMRQPDLMDRKGFSEWPVTLSASQYVNPKNSPMQ